MENAQRAIIMGASALLFVMALSVAIYLYSSVSYNVDNILTSSENNSREAEYFIQKEENTTRTVSKAEIIMTIIGLSNSTSHIYDKVTVNNVDFLAGTNYSESSNLRNIISSTTEEYIVIEENFSANSIKFISST